MSEQQDPKNEDSKLKATGSLGQQLLIAVLVVAVGVLFGMGPVLENLRQPGLGETRAGIKVSDINAQIRAAERLQALLNPSGFGPDQFLMSRDPAAAENELLYARLAEQSGLAPSRMIWRVF